MKSKLMEWAQLIGIGVALIVVVVLAWVVFGSIPPGCHNKIDPGFCVTRHKRFNDGIPGQRSQAPRFLHFLAATGR